jgi:hypothetical protein
MRSFRMCRNHSSHTCGCALCGKRFATPGCLAPCRKVATAEKIQCPFAGCGVTVRVEEMKSHLDICPFGKFLNKVCGAQTAAAPGQTRS